MHPGLLRKYIRALISESVSASPDVGLGTIRFTQLDAEGFFSIPGSDADYQVGFDDFYLGRRIAVYLTPPNPYHLNPTKPHLVEKWVKDKRNLQIYVGYNTYSEIAEGNSGLLGPAQPRNKQYMKGWTTAAYVSGYDSDYTEDYPEIDEAYKRPSKRRFNSWKKSIYNQNGKPVVPLMFLPGTVDGSMLSDTENPLHGIPNAEYGVVKTSHLGIEDYHDYWMTKKGIPIEDHPTLSSLGFVKA